MIVLTELREHGGVISAETNFRLARKAFDLTARYVGGQSQIREVQKAAFGSFLIS